jgi:hypothetical protein
MLERRCRHGNRRAEPHLSRRVQDARCADRSLEQLASAVMAARIDGDEPLHWPTLRLDRVQGRGQPTSAVMGNEHRCDDVTGADQMVMSDGR